MITTPILLHIHNSQIKGDIVIGYLEYEALNARGLRKAIKKKLAAAEVI